MAEEVPVPITEEDRQRGEDMLTFLKNSQDPVKAEELQLRGGVGLAAPQLDISKRIIAVHVPSNDPENETPSLSTVMYNPKILSHSVQDVCLGEGKAVYLSIGMYLGMSFAITKLPSVILTWLAKTQSSFKNYEAIVVQHEIDHINGIMFYDHINKENPFALKRAF